MALMYPGNAVVYFNGKEFGPDRDFPKAGRGDALGGVYGETIKRLLSIRQSHGRGDFYERWIDNEGIFIFERGRTRRLWVCPIAVMADSMNEQLALASRRYATDRIDR